MLKIFSEVYHDTIILTVIVGFMLLVGGRLLALDYPKSKVRLFVLLAIGMFLSAGYLGSRVTTISYPSFEQRNLVIFFVGMLFGEKQTFQISPMLSLLICAVICRLTRLKYLETLDTTFLYMPLAHSFGFFACLLSGCYWGRVCHINLYGLQMHFQNPVQLYGIIVNICLFLFLRNIHRQVYSGPTLLERFRGTVFFTYFMINPAIRIILEVFSCQRSTYFGLTQAQLTMGIYLFFSMAIFILLWYRHRQGQLSLATNRGFAVQNCEHLKRMLSLTFFVASYLVIIFVVYYLTQTNKVWQWPFRHVSSLYEAYMRIPYYLPMMVVPIYSLYWLEYSNIRTRQYFRWKRFSWTFLLGLAISIYYTLELLVFKRLPSIRGIEFWPPIVVLSFLNAISEEIMYRLALYRLIRQAEYPKWVASVVQSLIYSLIHYMISGTLTGTFSLIYGLVMQLVVNRNRSIIPAVICHFIIDIGCIGVPVLRMR